MATISKSKPKGKKVKKTRAITGRREYDLAIPSYQGVHTGSAWTTQGDKSGTPPLHGNGWQANGASCIFYESYFDLSALELDDLTLIPLDVGLQDPGFYTITPSSGNGSELIVMDIISQQRLDANTLSTFMTPTLNQYNNAPGMGGTDIDFHMITMGNMRIMYKSNQVSTSSTLIPFITQFSAPFGSGAPVVTQKLWVYRFIYYEGRVNEPMEIPASRFIMKGLVSKEKKYLYIQRLKQSYELQQG